MDDHVTLRGLKNIGPTIADRLESVGLKTVGDLKKIGPAEAFHRVKNAYPDITIPVCYYLVIIEVKKGRLPATRLGMGGNCISGV